MLSDRINQEETTTDICPSARSADQAKTLNGPCRLAAASCTSLSPVMIANRSSSHSALAVSVCCNRAFSCEVDPTFAYLSSFSQSEAAAQSNAPCVDMKMLSLT